MRIKLALVTAVLVSQNFAFGLSADAGRWDYAYSFGLRSQPIGAAVWGELGYSHLLWGDSPSRENPFYGYLRPKISAQSSGKVNRADLGIDIALWAPVVFEVSQSWEYRSGDFDQFDCTVLQCRGLLTRTKIAAKLTAGIGTYFLLWDSLMETVTGPKSPVRDFGDQSWALRGSYQKDTLLGSELTLGKKLSDTLSVGVRGGLAQFQDSKEESKTVLGFATIRNSGLQYFIGAGYYESSRIEPGFTSAFGLRWVGKDSFSIR